MKSKQRRMAIISISYSILEYLLKGKLGKLHLDVEGIPNKFRIVRVNDSLDIHKVNQFTVTIESNELPILEEGMTIPEIKPIYREKRGYT